jgi:2-dehydro-3-deoxyphosphogluconate aldolase/(4S)-4-hydroxy-2-oxoglutarate aldolase
VTVTAAAQEILSRLRDVRIVPVTSFDDGDQAEAVANALVRGGITCIEVTFRTAAAADAISKACRVEGLLVGAGTILSVEQLHTAIRAGAHFAVSPGTNAAVVRAAQEAGLPFFPGVATPSEIEHAREMGLDAVKVFPAGPLGGPSFLKAVAAVYPDVRFIPTGGVDGSNFRDYLAAPGVLAVGGSWIAPKELVRSGRYDEIERLAREAHETHS